MAPKLYGLDLETECAVEGCHDKECGHALDFNRNRITVIAVTDGEADENVFRGDGLITEFRVWLCDNPQAEFTAHLGKFDFKQLASRSSDLSDRWVHDSCLLAFTHQEKIPEHWLADYEMQRRVANKQRTGLKHREAGKHSLKTLAPYFLGVQPFWEPEHGHDDDEYVLKDARYSLALTNFFLKELPERSVKFYQQRQLPWAKMLLAMELKGIRLNTERLMEKWKETEGLMWKSDVAIREQWREHFEEFLRLQEYEVKEKYNAMELVNVTKGRWSSKQQARHFKNMEKALTKLEPLNLNSPKQLMWLLRDQLQLEAVNLRGEESTDKETLTRLAASNEEVRRLLEYRKAKKLCSTYFPEYKAYTFNGRIHSTFNSTGTRTGRLSASDPNLQQVPGALHDLFEADEGKVLITRDLSAIEPTVLAYYSEDPILCELMINGDDFHGTTAVAAFELDCQANEVKKLYKNLRDVAKTIGLAVLYGAGANQVYLVLQKEGFANMSLSDAKRIVYRIRDKFKGVWQFKQALDAELEGQNAVIYNLKGRPLSIPAKDEVYMKGLNTLIQSSASDLMQEAAFTIWRKRIAEPLLLVHDELVCQVDEKNSLAAEKEIIYWMEGHPLRTSHGNIPIRTEGKISKFWEK